MKIRGELGDVDESILVDPDVHEAMPKAVTLVMTPLRIIPVLRSSGAWRTSSRGIASVWKRSRGSCAGFGPALCEILSSVGLPTSPETYRSQGIRATVSLWPMEPESATPASSAIRSTSA